MILGILLLFAGITYVQALDIDKEREFESEAKELYQEARKIFREGETKQNWDEALQAYQRIIDNFPESQVAPMAQYQIAWIYHLRVHNYQRALKEYKKIIEEYPLSQNAISGIDGLCQLYKFRFKDLNKLKEEYQPIIAQYKKILKKSESEKDKAFALYALGSIYERLRDKRALEMYQRVVDEHPDSRWAHSAKRLLVFKEVDYTISLCTFDDVYYRNPSKDLIPGASCQAEVIKGLQINPHSAIEKPFACSLIINTEDRIEETTGGRRGIGKPSITQLPDGRYQAQWQASLDTATLGRGLCHNFDTSYNVEKKNKDIRVIRHCKRIGKGKQLITIEVTAPQKVYIDISLVNMRREATIDTDSVKPTPTSAYKDRLYFWGEGRGVGRDVGIDCSETKTFSFAVNLPQNVDYYYYPEVEVGIWRSEQRTLIEEKIQRYQNSFGSAFFILTSDDFFKVDDLEENIRRSWTLQELKFKGK